MKVNDNQIAKTIWKLRLQKLVRISVIVIPVCIVISMILATHVTVGKPEIVVAIVEGKGINQGMDGNAYYIICELPQGRLVNVFVDENQSYEIGQKVELLRRDRWLPFLGGKYYEKNKITDN